MPRICFKRRASGTVQLVRHVYSATSGRTRTITVGTMPADADCEYEELWPTKLRAALGDEDVQAVKTWLRTNRNGQPSASRKRLLERLEHEVRARMANPEGTGTCDALHDAENALTAAAVELRKKADALRAAGHKPWETLREPYVGVYRAWKHFAKVAQDAEVAIQRERRSVNAEATPEASAGPERRRDKPASD